MTTATQVSALVEDGNACATWGDSLACCKDMKAVDPQAAFAMVKQLDAGYSPFVFDNTVFLESGHVRVVNGANSQVGLDAKMGLMSATGELVVPFEWDFIDMVCGGQARACKGCQRECAGNSADCEHWSIKADKWTCIDVGGRTVPCEK